MNMRVYDPIIQTVAGGAYVQGGGSGKPQLIGQAFVDKMTAMTSAQASLTNQKFDGWSLVQQSAASASVGPSTGTDPPLAGPVTTWRCC